MEFSSKIVNYWAKLQPGRVYHIYNHAVGSDNLFVEPENYGFFLGKWQLYWENYMDIYAYCLMPNHFHVLGRIKPLSEEVLLAIEEEGTAKSRAFLADEVPINVFYESQFKRFFTSYSRAFGKKYKRVGSLFRAKFKRTRIYNKVQLLEKLYYVHHNPIHHGFYQDYHSWRYNSYHEFLNLDDSFVFLPILKYFGDSEDEQLTGFYEAHEAYRLSFSGISELSDISKMSDNSERETERDNPDNPDNH